MPPSPNEIKDRALRFSGDWAEASRAEADPKSVWDAFFDIFGVSRRRVATLERRVPKLGGGSGYIDLLWKGMLLIEHKSCGSDLDRTHAQARGYLHGLSAAQLPWEQRMQTFEAVTASGRPVLVLRG